MRELFIKCSGIGRKLIQNKYPMRIIRLKEGSGIYTPFFALILVSLLLLCGLAIDGGNLYINQLRLQRAVDAGAMRAIPHLIENSPAEAKDIAEKTALANIASFGIDPDSDGVSVIATPQGNSRLSVVARMPVKLYLMNRIPSGFGDQMPVGAQAISGRPKTLISLVLDLTGSMEDRSGIRNEDCAGTNPDPAVCKYKIHALRDAALSFFDGLNGQYDAFSLVVFSGTRSDSSDPNDGGSELLVRLDSNNTDAEVRAEIQNFGARRNNWGCDNYWQPWALDSSTSPPTFIKDSLNRAIWCFKNNWYDGPTADGRKQQPPFGATGISHGIRRGVKHIEEYLANQEDPRDYKKHMVIMTDGIPNVIDGAFIQLPTIVNNMTTYVTQSLSPTCGHGGTTLPPDGYPATAQEVNGEPNPWYNYSHTWGSPRSITNTRVAADIARRKGIIVHVIGFGMNRMANCPASQADCSCPDPMSDQFNVSCHKASGLIPLLIRRLANTMAVGDPEYTNGSSLNPSSPERCEDLWRTYQAKLDDWVVNGCPINPGTLNCSNINSSKDQAYFDWLKEDCACHPTVDPTGPKFPAGVAATAENTTDLIKAFDDVRKSIFSESRLVQ